MEGVGKELYGKSKISSAIPYCCLLVVDVGGVKVTK